MNGLIRTNALPCCTELETSAGVFALPTVANIGVDINTLIFTLRVEFFIVTVELALTDIFSAAVFCLDTLVASRALVLTLSTVEGVFEQVNAEAVAKS